ncbi:MAG TPA: phosphate ABC transporter permease PstA [Planctomycetes bacterium]|nr:phosphate ABC transporter permease PstA [Planctomycetota bacterium]
MRLSFRYISDKAFTGLTAVSVVLLSLVLIVVLAPMIWRGSSAVVFKATVEFRKMQMDLFNRGEPSELQAEIARTESFRKEVYETLDKFKKGIDTESLSDQARRIHRQFGSELRLRNITGDEYTQLRSLTRELRDRLLTAFESRDIAEIRENIEYVSGYKNDPRLTDTSASALFELGTNYLESAQSIDLKQFEQYSESIEEIEQSIRDLFGPRPGEPTPAGVRLRYGATRWDQAAKCLDRLFWAQKWVETEPAKPLIKIKLSRAHQFAGTELEKLFEYMEQNVQKLLNPRLTFYWQYFIDDSFNSHYFGGVGPEILGTVLITLLGMLFVVPLGLISAAYLVECASDNPAVRIIRMCINTLAGVPSIVFGLFGLTFFILYLFPLLGAESKGCILAASLTLAVLTLPVMIRASEEAIRAVPQTYKEASLSLGASGFRTFVTVTLPAALPGILTGVILSLSRIAGETAPILFTGAVALGPVPKSVFDPTRTLSYGSYDMAVGDRISMMVPHNQYGMVVTLVILILCLNTLAIVLRTRVFKKLKGQ